MVQASYLVRSISYYFSLKKVHNTTSSNRSNEMEVVRKELWNRFGEASEADLRELLSKFGLADEAISTRLENLKKIFSAP